MAQHVPIFCFSGMTLTLWVQPAPGPSSALPRCWIQLLAGLRLWAGAGHRGPCVGSAPRSKGSPWGAGRHTQCPLTATCLDTSPNSASWAATAFHCCLSPVGPSHPHSGCGSSRGQSPWGRAVLTLTQNSCPGKGGTGCPSSKAISSRENPPGLSPGPRNGQGQAG